MSALTVQLSSKYPLSALQLEALTQTTLRSAPNSSAISLSVTDEGARLRVEAPKVLVAIDLLTHQMRQATSVHRVDITLD